MGEDLKIRFWINGAAGVSSSTFLGRGERLFPVGILNEIIELSEQRLHSLGGSCHLVCAITNLELRFDCALYFLSIISFCFISISLLTTRLEKIVDHVFTFLTILA
jgi:hypothetical protein